MSSSSTSLDSAVRSYTALFVLLGRVLDRVLPACRRNGKKIDYPVNRPGQNTAECYTLALLSFVLVAGVLTVAIAGMLGSRAWSFVVALPLAVLAAFVAFHVLFFGVAFLYHRLMAIHFFSPNAPEQVPATVYLHLLTLLAASIAVSGELAYLIVVAPWLAWTLVNFAAAVILFAEDFISLLGRKVE